MYLIAKVAVAGAVISIDKAYDYLVPPSLEEEAQGEGGSPLPLAGAIS